jgi:FMN-dependent NADH-azoreductase
MNLLHVDSSALGANSVSRELGAAIVAALRRAHPGARVTYRDLAAQPLPHWTPVADADDPAARDAAAVLDEFLAADVVVIGAPMYNFSIPSTLKAWLDRIAVAGKTFRYGAAGAEGLAGGKRVIVASSRGGSYGAGTPAAAADFQEPYLRQLFAFLGVDDIGFVRAEGVNLGPGQKRQAIAAAHAEIRANERRAA